MISLRALVTGALALMAAPIMAAPTAETPTQIIGTLKNITAMSNELQLQAKSITASNAALIAIGGGPFPRIFIGMSKLDSDAEELFKKQQKTAPFTGQQSDNIFNAYRGFVSAHGKFLDTLRSKAKVANLVPVASPPVLAALRHNEATIDTLGQTLLILLPSKAAEVQSQSTSLETASQECIASYSPPV